jgi:hypothetical protein
MPKQKIRDGMKCSVPGCTETWIVASRRRLTYCYIHYEQSLELYTKYKEWTQKGLSDFDDHSLTQAISLRKEFSEKFTTRNKRGEHHEPHVEFVKLLESLLSHPVPERSTMSERLLKEFNEIYLS